MVSTKFMKHSWKIFVDIQLLLETEYKVFSRYVVPWSFNKAPARWLMAEEMSQIMQYVTWDRSIPNVPKLLSQVPFNDGFVSFWSLVYFDSIRFDTIRFGSVRLGSAQLDSTRFGLVRLGFVWFSLVLQW